MLYETDSDEEELLLLLALCEEKPSKIRKKRKWIQDVNLKRERDGEFLKMCKELESCEDKFFFYFHMSRNSFEELHDLIQTIITKTDTNWRNSISSRERLAITLRYLTTGDSYRTIANSFLVGCSTVSNIVKEVCIGISNILQPIFIPSPTDRTWIESEAGYMEMWNFPNCIGSIDGKHVQVRAPGSTNPNSSIVLITVINPFGELIIADAGSYGDYNDRGIFEQSRFYREYVSRKILLPKKPLPGSDYLMSPVFIGDDGFGLRTYLMRPYPKNVTKKDKFKKRFNIRLRSARKVVGKTFDILTAQWKFLNRPLESSIETAIPAVKAACCLYNFVKSKHPDVFKIKPEDESDYSALIPIRSTNHRSPNEALKVREKYTEYFKNEKKKIKKPVVQYIWFLFTFLYITL